MKYLHRLLEHKLLRLSQQFPVMALVGARQVGKTTLLRHILPEVACYTFDPVIDIGNARSDPELFLNHVATPVILDEIQFSPELLTVIKRRVDQTAKNSQYWLTGSQNLSILKNVAESLAGRVAIQTLQPMTLGEAMGHPSQWIVNFLQDPEVFLKTPQNNLARGKSLPQLIWRGGYPGMLTKNDEALHTGLASYLSTYIERDVRLLSEVSDWHVFSRFVQIIANLTAQEINYSHLGREIGISPHTAQKWLAMLIGTFQWREIPAFSGNTLKRISGKPKGYFIDTGMACHLMHITSAQALLGHPRFGALFETFVVQDLLRQLSLLPVPPAVYHWRSHAGAEVDLILEINACYYPIEIKAKSHPQAIDTRGIENFRATYPRLNLGPGLIIAPVQAILPLRNNCFAVPFDSY